MYRNHRHNRIIRGTVNSLIERLEIRRLLAVVGPDAYGYAADATSFENINLAPGGPGVFAIPLSGEDIDDVSVPVDLGSNVFRFYGANFTGNNQLFVSSNGLITFGTANTSYSNSDLTQTPSERAIAPLWDDLINAQEVLGKFENTDADPENDRLIIEWTTFHIESDPRTDSVTFQAILQLNTGPIDGDIVFNYPDLSTGTTLSTGLSPTVGIKDLGDTADNRLLITLDSLGSLVQQGQALRIVAQEVFARLSADGTLSITGTDAGDTLGITSQITGLRVRLNNNERTFAAENVRTLVISTKGGNDVIDWSGIRLPGSCDAGDGDDLVLCGSSSDTVTGGNGNDRIVGGDGADVLAGNAQADRIDGGLGKDLLNGHGGRDKLSGGGANDTLKGGASGDFLAGGGGPDLCMGEGGNDRIAGGVGAGDILTGGAGDDLLIANDSFLDSLFGDSGNDTSIADPDDVLVGVETQT